MVRFLREDVQLSLHDRIVDDIYAGRAAFLRPSCALSHTGRGFHKGSRGRECARRMAAVRRVFSEDSVSENLLGEAAAAFTHASGGGGGAANPSRR
jgi:hypothetical protein